MSREELVQKGEKRGATGQSQVASDGPGGGWSSTEVERSGRLRSAVSAHLIDQESPGRLRQAHVRVRRRSSSLAAFGVGRAFVIIEGLVDAAGRTSETYRRLGVLGRRLVGGGERARRLVGRGGRMLEAGIGRSVGHRLAMSCVRERRKTRERERGVYAVGAAATGCCWVARGGRWCRCRLRSPFERPAAVSSPPAWHAGRAGGSASRAQQQQTPPVTTA
jgi:hypothetical protein